MEEATMRLISIDPGLLKPNPHNPRRTAAPALSDQQLAVNIDEVGLLQPPLVRELADGTTMIVAGHRRVAACVTLKRLVIDALVVDDDTSDDAIRALSENVQRQNLGPVDQWRAIEHCLSDRWTEEAIAVAMGMSVRTIRKLRLLASIHPAILDRIAVGDMPEERFLRTIAAAGRCEQAAVWKRHRPTKTRPSVTWYQVAQALEKWRLSATIAKFGLDEEQAFGIVWEEDLFEQADKDCRFTTQIEAFLSAQQAWLEANLPKNAVLLPMTDHGEPKLPPKAQRSWGKPSRGDTVGYYVNPRTGAVDEIGFRLPEPATKKGEMEAAGIPVPRPEITKKGMALIGDLRTEALHKAIAEGPITDETLFGLLVLALAAANVMVDGPRGRFTVERRAIAGRLVEGGRLTEDLGTLRQAARGMLAEVFSCRKDASNSGMFARLCGTTVNADAWLPNMATEEFLSCLSKAGVERAAGTINVLPRQRAKDTRAALINQVGEGIFVLPAARFALTADEVAEIETRAACKPQDDEARDSGEADGAADEEAVGDGEDGPAPWEHGQPGSSGEEIRLGA
jgi:ParB family transcriptional regulator, chromosome partitioning protein